MESSCCQATPQGVGGQVCSDERFLVFNLMNGLFRWTVQNLMPMIFNCDSADQRAVQPPGCHCPARPLKSKFDKREEWVGHWNVDAPKCAQQPKGSLDPFFCLVKFLGMWWWGLNWMAMTPTENVVIYCRNAVVCLKHKSWPFNSVGVTLWECHSIFSLSAVVAKQWEKRVFQHPLSLQKWQCGRRSSRTKLSPFFGQHLSATSQVLRKGTYDPNIAVFFLSVAVTKQWVETCF